MSDATGRTRTSAQQAGDAAEDLVARRLRALGWRVLAVRQRIGRLELDLVAVDPGPPAMLVAVEVRWRRRRDYGLAEETVDRRKIGRLRRAMGELIARGSLPDGTPLPVLAPRLDVVVAEPGPPGAGPRIRHHRGIG